MRNGTIPNLNQCNYFTVLADMRNGERRFEEGGWPESSLTEVWTERELSWEFISSGWSPFCFKSVIQPDSEPVRSLPWNSDFQLISSPQIKISSSSCNDNNQVARQLVSPACLPTGCYVFVVTMIWLSAKAW